MISYSTRQRDFADRVRDWLEGAGHAPKLDHLDIAAGDRFARTLASWLAACHVAVVLVSEDALASGWVRYELSVLVNRERLDQDVRVVLVLLDGLDLATVASRPELASLDLATLQARVWPGPAAAATDAAIADLLAGALDDVTEAPIETLADRAHDTFRDAGDATVARARYLLLQRVGATPDPWRDEPASGDIAALRRALARDLCHHALQVIYEALAELAEDTGVRHSAYTLVDLNAMTSFDPAALRAIQVAWAGAPHCGVVVLGFTTQVLADLAVRAVREILVTSRPFLHPIVSPLTGNGTDEVVDGIVAELEASMGEDEDLDRYLGELVAVGHPVVLLLTRPEGLSPEVLGALRRRLPGVAVMVLASRRIDPGAWATRLPGALLAGPHLEDASWADLVMMEEALVACRTTVLTGLRRVMAAQ